MESKWHWGNKWWAQDISSWWLASEAQGSWFVVWIDRAEKSWVKWERWRFRILVSVKPQWSSVQTQLEIQLERLWNLKTSCVLQRWHRLHEISNQPWEDDWRQHRLLLHSLKNHAAPAECSWLQSQWKDWNWQNERFVTLRCYHLLPQKVRWVCTWVSGIWENLVLSGIIQR